MDPEAAIFRIEVRSYLLNVDGLNVLIDTCCGNDKERSVPWAHRLQSQWLQNLAGAGCDPADIQLVLCTHLHADHVGWNTRLEDGRWIPRFRTLVTCSAARTLSSLDARRVKLTIESLSTRCCRWSRRALPTSWRAATASIARSRMASGSRMRPAILPAASSSTPSAAECGRCSRATSSTTRSTRPARHPVLRRRESGGSLRHQTAPACAVRGERCGFEYRCIFPTSFPLPRTSAGAHFSYDFR